MGDGGWLETGDSGETVVEPASLLPEVNQGKKIEGIDVSAHARNFFDCVKSRSAPLANAEVMLHSHVACHAAALAWILQC